MPNNITVKDALNANQDLRTVETGGVHTPVHRIEGYDAQDDMVKVKSVQKKWRDSFTVVGAPDTNKWDTVVGTGGAASIVTAGVVRLSSGTTINSATSITSKETFTIPFRVSVGLTLSQRIANQSFFIEAVSVDPSTGVPDGNHCLSWLFDGTTATQAKYEVQNGGLARLTSTAQTVPTTVGGVSVYELEPYADEAWFHGGTLDATTGRANSYRRHQQIPDPNALYKVRLRWLNSGTAPASSTNADIQYISVQDYAELTAEITAGRGNTVAGNAMSVLLAGATAASTPIGTVAVSGNPAVAGAVAHDSPRAATAPVINGARAVSANYAAVASGDVADLITTLVGALVVKPFAIPETDWQYVGATGGITNTTAVTLAGAPAAGLRRYITGLQVSNDSATATEIVIEDTLANAIWRCRLPANTPNFSVVFPTPLRAASAAVALQVVCATTGAKVHINAQGYTAP
jgi:hypothetical protein